MNYWLLSYLNCRPELLMTQDLGRAFFYDSAIGIPIIDPKPEVELCGPSAHVTNPYLTTLKRRTKLKKKNLERSHQQEKSSKNVNVNKKMQNYFKFRNERPHKQDSEECSRTAFKNSHELCFKDNFTQLDVARRCCKCLRNPFAKSQVNFYNMKKFQCCSGIRSRKIPKNKKHFLMSSKRNVDCCEHIPRNLLLRFPSTCGVRRNLLENDCDEPYLNMCEIYCSCNNEESAEQRVCSK